MQKNLLMKSNIYLWLGKKKKKKKKPLQKVEKEQNAQKKHTSAQ